MAMEKKYNKQALLHLFGLTLLSAIMLPACTQEPFQDQDAVRVEAPARQLTFTATMDVGTATRTVMGAGGMVTWSPYEDINIFYGEGAGSKFSSSNATPSDEISFTGKITAFTGSNDSGTPLSFWGVYPYDSGNRGLGDAVTAYLPTEQVAVAGSFANRALLSVAESPGLTLSFKNVCSLLSFTVTHPGIQSVTFSGANGEEVVAGRVKVSMSGGIPEWESLPEGGSSSITLNAPSGETLTVGATYYIALLPQTFSNGFKVVFVTEDQVGVRTVAPSGKTFTRATPISYTAIDNNDKTAWTARPGPDFIGFSEESMSFTTGEEKDLTVTVSGPDGYLFDPAKFVIWGEGDEETTGLEISPYQWIRVGDSWEATIHMKAVDAADSFLRFCYGLTEDELMEAYLEQGEFPQGELYTCSELPYTVGIPFNEIWYTTTDGNKVDINFIDKGYPSAWTIENSYSDGKGIIRFKSSAGSPATVSDIKAQTFAGATTLKTVVLPDYVQVIGESAFSGCSNLTSVRLETSTQIIRNNAFEACEALTDINLPEGLRYLGSEAFKNCESLQTVTLPGSLTGIGVGIDNSNNVVNIHAFNPFAGCISLTGFYGSGNTYYRISEDHKFLLSADGTFLFSGAIGGFENELCRIPDGVETIGMEAFCRGKSGKLELIAASLKRIEDLAFCNYTQTEYGSFFVPENVNYIGQFAFDGFTFTSSDNGILFSGDVLPVLGQNAFGDTETYPLQITGTATLDEKLDGNPWSAYLLNKRVLPYQDSDEIWFHVNTATVPRLSSSLDFGSDDLPAHVDTDYNGFVFYTSNFGTPLPCIPFPEEDYSYVAVWKFDQPVQSIPAEAFMGNNGLDYISISSGVTRIGDCAFSGCGSLLRFPVVAPEMFLTSIGTAAFQGCEKMDAGTTTGVLNLGNVTTLGTSAFNSCKKLGTIVLGQITCFPNYSFSNCENLESVWITDAANSANAVNCIEDVDIAAFANCPKLKRIDSRANTTSESVNLPGVTYVFPQAFDGCSSIKSVTLGRVTSIPEYAFNNCLSLERVNVLLYDLTSIGQNAFYNCPALKKVNSPTLGDYVYIGNVTSIGTSAFANSGVERVEAGQTQQIGASAFANCPNLWRIEVPKATALSTNCFLNDNKLTTVIASKATLVGEYAFYKCTKLATLNLPAVTKIGDKAFAYTRGLTTLDLGENLEKFGNEVFYDDDASLRNTNKLSLYLRGRKWYDNWDNTGSSYNWNIYDAFNYNLSETNAFFQFKTISVPAVISSDFSQGVQYSFGTGNYILSL